MPETLIASHLHAETLRDDLYPIAGKIDHHCQQRAQMQRDIEIEPLPPASPGATKSDTDAPYWKSAEIR